MQNSFFDTTERLLAQVSTPQVIRQIEHGGDTAKLWESLEDSGFVQALLAESAGGAGLTLEEVWPVMFSAGRHAVPLPFVHTLLARAWLNHREQVIPDGSVTFAPFQLHKAGDGLTARAVSFGRTADWVLAQHDGQVWLLPVSSASVVSSGGHATLDADLKWPAEVASRSLLGRWSEPQFESLLAIALAVLIAGAADRVFEMTLDYANQRVQFGKPIGKFQALQQQISEMAEQVFGARMAAQMACRSTSWQPLEVVVAMAKTQTSQAVARISAVAHAVHGAIGVTHEYDLQLYTRRLNEWARLGGGAGYWSEALGATALNADYSAFDFMRRELFGEEV
jgi:alkylation response protein AidB-like acyl-CoA dehydrogenase